jgi:hypothetical protein
MRTRLLVTLAATLLAGACSEPPTARQDPVADALGGNPVQLVRFTQYFPADNSGFERQTRVVVSSQAAWEAAWRQIWKNESPVPPAPAVNFDTHVVLLASMGVRGSGGHTVRLAAAANRGDHVGVRVIETSPGSSCVTTAAITEPVDVVLLPRTPLPVLWETDRVVHECR